MVNVKGFEVQRSTDGANYGTQGYVAATAANDYRFHELLSGNGHYYYRLRMIDTDGKYTYSPVRLLLLSEKADVVVYPNPANNELHISTGAGAFRYRLVDAQNRMVRSGQSLSASLDLDITTSIASGIYFIEIETGGQKIVRRIAKQ